MPCPSRSLVSRARVLFRVPSPMKYRRPSSKISTGAMSIFDGNGGFSNLQILLYFPNNLADLERAAFHFREGNGVDQVTGADHGGELAEVHLGNDHGFESRQHLTQISRERIQVSKMRRRNTLSFTLHLLNR